MKRLTTFNQFIYSLISFKAPSIMIVFCLLFISSKIQSQIPDSILSPTDTNYFQITSKIDAYINSLPSSGSGSMVSGSGGSGSSTIDEDGWEANYAHWKNVWQNKIDNTGNFIKYYKAFEDYSSDKISYKNFCHLQNLTQDYEWKCLGPFSSPTITLENEHQGQINAISVNPVDENDILVGNYNGGIWKSSNGGSTWVNKTDGFSNYDNQGTNCIERMPNYPNIVFANTLKNNVGRWTIGREIQQVSKGIIMSNDDG